MSDLVEFLTARVDEDERVARSAIAERNDGIANGEYVPGMEPEPERDVESWNDWGGGPGIRMGAERLLADVAAKRAILEAAHEEHSRAKIRQAHADGTDCPGGCEPERPHERDDRLRDWARWAGLDRALRLLAAVYSDHPDYRDEWR